MPKENVMIKCVKRMNGRTPDPSLSKIPDSASIAKKIAAYAKSDPFGQKFLKYLSYVSVLKRSKGSYSGRGSSPWMELRQYGALEEVMLALKQVFLSEEVKSLSEDVKTKPSSASVAELTRDRDRVRDICNVAMSILSNAFALDYTVRAQAVNNGFANSLQQFISNFTQNASIAFKNAEIISRAVKCTANLSNSSHCRESVLKTGVAISIIKLLELADDLVTSSSGYATESEKSGVDKGSHSHLICSCIRAIRILASDSKFSCSGRDHLLKFGGLVAVINVLTWDAELSSNEDLVLDFIRALTLLAVKIRSAPGDVIDKLIYNPEVCKLRCLVRIFESSQSEGKLYSPIINCLTNLCSNKEISDCLGGLRIFHIILEKLDNSDESYYCDLIKLLIALTRYSSFNQSHLTTSSLIGSTLKILKSTHLKEFHSWLLAMYEKLYEGSLSKLIQCGLVNHLCDILRGELEECDYDCLRRKISTFDDGRCSVHQAQGEVTCPFAPVYRCSSPSYQKIQEEMKTLGTIVEIEGNRECQQRGEDSLSPFSSPAHSVTSGSSSPFYSGASYSSFSEDEGCYSSSPIHFQKRSKSGSPGVDNNADKMELSASSELDGDSDACSPVKKRKLEDGSSSSSDNSRTRCSKSLDALKTSAKKIVSVLNILYKCSHISPFPQSILEIMPILLGIMVRGKVSLMPQRVHYEPVESDDEFRELSRRTFEVSYKIILKMCSIIQIFPEMIVSGVIPVLHRLQEPLSSANSMVEKQIGIVQEYCSNLITRMVGIENETAGWREGFIMRSLLVNNSSISDDKMDQTVLNIPLLYEKHPIILRKFERKAKSWTKILDMLVNSDETSFYRFEDCALALCSICSALGVKWKPYDAGLELPSLLNIPVDVRKSEVIKVLTADDEIPETRNEEIVILTLDDGSTLLVNKELLIKASPVFSAMFTGHFVENLEQKVHLPNVSLTGVCLLLNQLFMLTQPTRGSDHNPNSQNQYELATIFELFSLADRFLLDDIYERALNTLITKYICPNSAPIIYAESVKLVNFQKSNNNRQMLGDSSLNLFILKYILTATGIRMSERCNAVRKVFDMVMSEHVVRDLKALIEHNMYKS